MAGPVNHPERIKPTQVILDLLAERRAQDEKWGQQNHRDGTGRPEDVGMAGVIRTRTQRRFDAGMGTWRDILDEEVAEAYAEKDPDRLRQELIQVGAVVIAWIEAIERAQRAVMA